MRIHDRLDAFPCAHALHDVLHRDPRTADHGLTHHDLRVGNDQLVHRYLLRSTRLNLSLSSTLHSYPARLPQNRFGLDQSSRLRVLELKKPAGDVDGALDQAVPYAAALRLLFERGPAYRMLLGHGHRAMLYKPFHMSRPT